MKNHLLFFMLLFGIGFTTLTAKETIQINIKFLSKKEAKKELSKEDSFSKNVTTIDSQIRLKRVDATPKELIDALSVDNEEWSTEDIAIINESVSNVENRFNELGIDLKLPKRINFIKSNMNAELNAGGFTRSSSIILNGNIIRKGNDLDHTIAHELFHITTRTNPELKKKLYAAIGFTVLDKEIEIPQDIKNIIISNPDVERHDSYANLLVNDSIQKCMICLVSNKEFTEGDHPFSYFRVILIPLDSDLIPIQQNETTVIYDFNKASNIYDLVGKNTNYIIDPEEILASNFASLVIEKKKIPSPLILENIQKVLAKK